MLYNIAECTIVADAYGGLHVTGPVRNITVRNSPEVTVRQSLLVEINDQHGALVPTTAQLTYCQNVSLTRSKRILDEDAREMTLKNCNVVSLEKKPMAAIKYEFETDLRPIPNPRNQIVYKQQDPSSTLTVAAPVPFTVSWHLDRQNLILDTQAKVEVRDASFVITKGVPRVEAFDCDGIDAHFVDDIATRGCKKVEVDVADSVTSRSPFVADSWIV